MIRKISLIILGGLFAFELYKSYLHDNILLLFIYLGLAIPWVILFILTILEERKIYEKNKRLIKLSSSFVGVSILLLNIGIYSYYETKVNSPTLIKARIFGGFTDFKKNGEYVIVSGSWASRTHFYGTYIIQDSILLLIERGLMMC